MALIRDPRGSLGAPNVGGFGTDLGQNRVQKQSGSQFCSSSESDCKLLISVGLAVVFSVTTQARICIRDQAVAGSIPVTGSHHHDRRSVVDGGVGINLCP